MTHKLKIGVLISGKGTNLQKIIDGTTDGTLDVEIVAVLSNVPGSGGIERAKAANIHALVIDPKDYLSSGEFNEAIARELKNSGAELVVLAGYMKLLGSEVIDRFENQVINLHPSLLPSYKGAHAIQDAYEANAKVSGVTVHFVNAKIDDGPIISQIQVSIDDDDTLESFETKIHEAEYKLLPEIIQLFAKKRVSLINNKVYIKPQK